MPFEKVHVFSVHLPISCIIIIYVINIVIPGDFTIRIPKPSIKTDGFYKCKFVQVEGGKIQRPIETVSAYINVTVKPEKPQINSVKNDKLFLIKKRKEGVEKAEILCTSNLGKPPPVIRLQVGDNQPLLPTSIKSEASGSTEEMRKLRNVTAKFEIDLDRSLENVKVSSKIYTRITN